MNDATRDELAAWWRAETEKDILAVVPKATEYGSNSLEDLGRSMGRMQGRDIGLDEAQELACFFYMQGKMGRWLDAIVSGRRPGDDTVYDIEIYARMVRRIRAAGTWPGPNAELFPLSPLEDDNER